MSQHLIKEIQELKRQVQQLKEADDISMDQLNNENAFWKIRQVEERVDMLQTSFKEVNESVTQLYNAVIELRRKSDPESEYPETQPVDPDETQWMEPDER